MLAKIAADSNLYRSGFNSGFNSRFGQSSKFKVSSKNDTFNVKLLTLN